MSSPPTSFTCFLSSLTADSCTLFIHLIVSLVRPHPPSLGCSTSVPLQMIEWNSVGWSKCLWAGSMWQVSLSAQMVPEKRPFRMEPWHFVFGSPMKIFMNIIISEFSERTSQAVASQGEGCSCGSGSTGYNPENIGVTTAGGTVRDSKDSVNDTQDLRIHDWFQTYLQVPLCTGSLVGCTWLLLWSLQSNWETKRVRHASAEA